MTSTLVYDIHQSKAILSYTIMAMDLHSHTYKCYLKATKNVLHKTPEYVVGSSCFDQKNTASNVIS